MTKAIQILAIAAAMLVYTNKVVFEPAPSYSKKVKIEVADHGVKEIRIG